MRYYAIGNGNILFSEVLSKEVYQSVIETLQGTFEVDGDRAWKAATSSQEITYIDFWQPGKYYEDDVHATLQKIADMKLPIGQGRIEYVGEDNSMWRFIYRNGAWKKENGHVEYSDVTVEELASAFSAYVENDLDAADPDYVRDVLEQCGANEKILRAIGLDGLFRDTE